MVTQDSRAPAIAHAVPDAEDEARISLGSVTMPGVMTVVGAAVGALGVVWLIFERLLPFGGVLGFWLLWYAAFLGLYGTMAWLQWDRREASHRVATVGFSTAGVLVLVIVVAQVLFALLKGIHVVLHLNFITQTMAAAGPLSGPQVGGVLHAIVGTLEQIGLATLFAVPLAVAAAVFMVEVGGGLARPVRVMIEAMTGMPDIIAGLFIYALVILDLGVRFCGMAAALALTVTMMPIIARASEVILRLVPGTLREASYALGGSQVRTVWHVTLPTARSGLSTAVVLGMARGIGETAPVLVVAGSTTFMNYNPLSGPQENLPFFIWNYAHVTGETAANIERGFGAGCVLVVLVLVLFTIARRIGGRAPGELSRRQRRRLTRAAAGG